MTQKLEEKFQIPWYHKGLPFQCTQCGKCCTGSPGYVWVSDPEIQEMANSLQITIPTFKRLYLRRIDNRWALVERNSQNHSCVFYQNQKCQVYTSRPLQCRTYPFWKENLNSEESWKLAAEECEGIHPEAPLFSEECITRALMEQ